MGLLSYVSLPQSSDSFQEFLSLPGVSAFLLLLSLGQFTYLLEKMFMETGDASLHSAQEIILKARPLDTALRSTLEERASSHQCLSPPSSSYSGMPLLFSGCSRLPHMLRL